jgi:hypothetical protein
MRICNTIELDKSSEQKNHQNYILIYALGTPRLSINYANSTGDTVWFNLHFDPVSFITLYRICNIRSSLFFVSLSKLFLSILKGRPIL